METKRQWGIVAGIVAVLAAALFIITTQVGSVPKPVAIGGAAPAFNAKTLDGAPKGLDAYRGRVVLLNIWATWCGPCRAEMPSIQALHQAYAPKGLSVVAVSVDDEGQEAQITSFGQEFGLSFELLHDATGSIQQVYQTAGVPESFVIARDGTIRKRWMGAEDWNSPANRALVEQLLAEPAP
ncbi:MAG: redoxin domain-containing protein [Gemmatimonadaceae bacterium]|jgi:thiol-disulfide isomerase/thioredoxin|nr:redoxin domain-containing protein [Gemmatimonadaceae bacterium]